MPRKPRQRARPGDGSVCQLKNGSWKAQISIGGRANRKRVVVFKSSEAAAVEALRKLRAEHSRAEVFEDEPIALEKFMARWLANIKPRIRSTTWDNYAATVKNHINPVLGAYRVDKIRPSHIHDALKELEAKDTGARTREFVYLRLRSALETAVGSMIVVNPVKPEHRPRVARKAMKTWTQDEARAFLESTESDWFGLMYRLALSVGMRRGELLGLRWEDVDLKARRLFVQRSISVKREVGELKTRSSRRSIQLPAKAAEALAVQRERLFAKGLRRTPWVFPAVDGEPLSPSYITWRFQKAIRKAGVSRIRFHDLRHSCATMMLQAGIHPKVASEILGHSSVAITLDLYSHVSESLQRDAADRLDAIL